METSTISSTYAYDLASRVSATAGDTITFYPSPYYSYTLTTLGTTTLATSTDYVYAGPLLLAQLDQDWQDGAPEGAATRTYLHTDNLGSLVSASDKDGAPTASFSYAPYGAPAAPSAALPRGYIGQYFDQPTDLSYLNARYYDPARGQFLSEDPVFLGQPNQQNLQDPQSLNPYSYARLDLLHLDQLDRRLLLHPARDLRRLDDRHHLRIRRGRRAPPRLKLRRLHHLGK